MTTFIACVIGGLAMGGTFALISLGLVLAFRATSTFNFAHGQIMLLAAYIVGAYQGALSPMVVLVAALVSTGIIGALFYITTLSRTTGMPLFMGIIATFGLAAILDGFRGLVFHEEQYTVHLPGLPEGRTVILGTGVSNTTLAVLALSLALTGLVTIGIQRTHLGLTIRAAGQDPLLASQRGINVRRLYVVSWVVAAVLAGVAGIMYGAMASANITIIDLALAALPAVVLGGMDSVGGAVVGGMIIGLLQAFTQVYIGGQYIFVVTYVLLLLVLLVIPQGLFGTREVVRA